MDENETQNQEDKGKIQKLEKELDVIGEKAKEEIQENTKPKSEQISKLEPEQEIPLPQQPVGASQDTQPAPQPQVEPQPQSAGMETDGKSKMVKIALILLIFSIFLAVLYFAKEYFLNPKPEPTLTPISISTPSPTPDTTVGWNMYDDNDMSFKYPQEWTLTSEKLIESSSPSAKLQVFEKDDAMSTKCMKEDDVQTLSGLLVKKYSASQTTGTCSSVVTGDEKEIWVVRESGNGYGPGIILSYSMSDTTEIEKIFDQILLTFEFMSEEECESCDATTSGQLN